MAASISVTKTFSSEAGSVSDGSLFLSAQCTSSYEVAKVEKQRRRLFLLHHASYCKHDGEDCCPDVTHCRAMKRLYKHVVSCRSKGRVCIVPGCSKMRSVWNHHRKCISPECQICYVLPHRAPSPVVLQTQKTPKNHQRPPTMRKNSAGGLSKSGENARIMTWKS